MTIHSERDVRVGSEIKLISSGRVTRARRAYSLSGTEDSLINWTSFVTPTKNRKRQSMLSSQPAVIEEVQDVNGEIKDNVGVHVVEMDDNYSGELISFQNL